MNTQTGILFDFTKRFATVGPDVKNEGIAKNLIQMKLDSINKDMNRGFMVEKLQAFDSVKGSYIFSFEEHGKLIPGN